MHVNRRQVRTAVAFLIAAVTTACTATGVTMPAASWGNEALEYFTSWSSVLTADDVYGALDFYTAEALVEGRKGGFEGSARSAPDWIAGHRADLGHELGSVYLDAVGAVATIHWPDSGDDGAVMFTLEAGLIDRQVFFVEAGSLVRSLLLSAESAAGVHALYEENAGAGRRTVEDPAVFVEPTQYGGYPQRVVVLYDVADPAGCSMRAAVAWVLDDGRIVDERLLPEVATLRDCEPDDLPTGWWTDLELPGPRDQIVTGSIETATGSISVYNGTSELNDLVRWGLGRFEAAGLEAPSVDSVTFEPTRRCEGVFGRFGEPEGSRDVVLCIDRSDLCADDGVCPVVPLAVRAGMLHELGHAWLIDHADAATRRSLLALSGRDEWNDQGVAWVDRGVEYAAEVMSWGLADEPLLLLHLGAPPCEQVETAFVLLTGVEPLPETGPCD